MTVPLFVSIFVACAYACGGSLPEASHSGLADESICGSRDAYEGGSFFEHEGGRLWYRLDGPASAPVIAVIHGGPGYNTYTFDATGGALLREHFRVLSFDQRGCGRSYQVDEGATFGMRPTIDDLEALRRHLGIECMHLLAHSFGGVVAAAYAATYPESVERIVFIETAPNIASALQHQLDSAAELSEELFPEHTDALRALAVSEEPLFQRIGAAYGTVGREPLQRTLHWASADNQSRADALDAESELLSCTQGGAVLTYLEEGFLGVDGPEAPPVLHPAVLFGGRASHVIGSAALEAASREWNAPLIWFEESGHFIYAEEPERFASEVRAFLTSALPAGVSAGVDSELASGVPRVIQLEEIRIPCPESSMPETRPVTPAQNAAMPEAIGAWTVRCEPGWEPDIWTAFIYDGRYITLRYRPTSRSLHDAADSYLPSPDETYRIESRWEGLMLSARLPGGRWVEVARFVDGVFVRTEREHTFEYDHDAPVPDALFAPHSVHDYEAEAHALRSAALARGLMPAVTRRCSSRADVITDGERDVGSVEFTIARDGCVSSVEVTHTHGALAGCVRDALRSTCLADYVYPESASYRYPLVVSPP